MKTTVDSVSQHNLQLKLPAVPFQFLEMGAKGKITNGSRFTSGDRAKSSYSIFEGFVISIVGIGFALLIFAAARNSLTWYVLNSVWFP